MAKGGGFCEKHGPFDPPHETCPFCAIEDRERRAYGPPPGVPESGQPPVPSSTEPPANTVRAPGFVRDTVEPAPEIEATELRPRAAEPEDEAPAEADDLGADAEAGAGAGGDSESPPEDALPDGDGDESEPEPPPLGWLVVREPVEHRGTVLEVAANQVIGRAGDIKWNDPRISRQHARLTVEPPDDDPDAPPVFHLWPFGPTNPVFINEREIRGATPLYENDEIRLGDTLFVFKVLTD